MVFQRNKIDGYWAFILLIVLCAWFNSLDYHFHISCIWWSPFAFRLNIEWQNGIKRSINLKASMRVVPKFWYIYLYFFFSYSIQYTGLSILMQTIMCRNKCDHFKMKAWTSIIFRLVFQWIIQFHMADDGTYVDV